IYGEGEKRKELKALAKDLGLEERILLPGNEEQVEEVIYRARVFVLPSNTEGMPNTLIEAMLLGITVIATDCPCGGPAELIVHGENGLLTPVGDVEKMKENLQRVLAHPREADRRGRNAARLRSLYEPEAVYGGWKAYLEGLMTKR
ncbi:MAG: glycosyltransferase, partial [Acetatifactor sp.]|nr:glycosyltransferase [Acetatifactor sp.]